MRFGVPTGLAAGVPVLVVVLAGSGAGLGCAHTDSVADRHIREMREAIGRIETERDRTSQRLELLESSEDIKPAPAPEAKPPRSGPSTSARTVQIGDANETSEIDDPNDPNARPEIRLQGQARASRPARSKSTSGRSRRDGDLRSDLDDPNSGSKSDSARLGTVVDPDAKKAYDAALALVRGKQEGRALEALSAFLTRWPDHPYAENATYWRGEAFYARGEYLRAAEQFEAVLSRALAQKAPDALLKIGLCHERLGSESRAREYWDRLLREYPRSDAAKKIPAGSKGDRGVGPKESR